MRHIKIEQVKDKIAKVKSRLSSFEKEIMKIDGSRELDIETGEFVRVADYLLDRLLAELLVHETMSQGKQSDKKVYESVTEMVSTLEATDDEMKRKMRSVSDRIAHLIATAK